MLKDHQECKNLQNHKKFEKVKCFNLGDFSLYKEMFNSPDQRLLICHYQEMFNSLDQRLLICHYHLMIEENTHATFIKKMPSFQCHFINRQMLKICAQEYGHVSIINQSLRHD